MHSLSHCEQMARIRCIFQELCTETDLEPPLKVEPTPLLCKASLMCSANGQCAGGTSPRSAGAFARCGKSPSIGGLGALHGKRTDECLSSFRSPCTLLRFVNGRSELQAASIFCGTVESFTAWAEDKKVFRLVREEHAKIDPDSAPILRNKMSHYAGVSRL